jgi:hypothetical protein
VIVSHTHANDVVSTPLACDPHTFIKSQRHAHAHTHTLVHVWATYGVGTAEGVLEDPARSGEEVDQRQVEIEVVVVGDGPRLAVVVIVPEAWVVVVPARACVRVRACVREG